MTFYLYGSKIYENALISPRCPGLYIYAIENTNEKLRRVFRTSYIAKPADVKRDWYVVDAEGKTLGRLATEIATILRGKNKPTFTPHVDGGDFVIVVNAEKVVLTGKKLTQKYYRYHKGYVGGLKEISYKEMMEKKPEEVVAHAVSGMLPKNKLRDRMMTRLRVYRGAEHPHAAQNPQVLNV